MPVAVHVGPEAEEEITGAVEAAGGVLAPLEEADAVVWLDSNPGEFPELPPSVRWVQLPSAGVERWVERVHPDGPVFTTAAGAYAQPVAEHALALLLAGIHRTWSATWDPQPYRPLSLGASVAIVGAGGIGRALIAMLAPMGVEVVAVTRRGHDVPGAARTLPAERTDEAWGAADHVVLAAPATAATRRLVGAEQLAAMRDGAWLVNVARGSLVDTEALVAALREGRIGGAALDVTDPEPLPDDHPLRAEPRAIITPHIAGPPGGERPLLAERVRENLERFAAGRDLVAPIDPQAGY